MKWDKARATASGLWGKSNWKTYPTQMLAARCVSEGVRALYPACLCGMYTPEEVSDFAPPQEPTQEPPQQVEAVVVDDVAQEPQKLFEAPKESPRPKATPETRKAGFLKAMEGPDAEEPRAGLQGARRAGLREAGGRTGGQD